MVSTNQSNRTAEQKKETARKRNNAYVRKCRANKKTKAAAEKEKAAAEEAKAARARQLNCERQKRFRERNKVKRLIQQTMTSDVNTNGGLPPPSSPGPHEVMAAIPPQPPLSANAKALFDMNKSFLQLVNLKTTAAEADKQRAEADKQRAEADKQRAEADKQRAHVASENQKDRELKLELEKYKARLAFEASLARLTRNRELLFPPATPETPKPVETPAASNQKKRPRDVHEDPPKKKRPCDYFYGPTAAGSSKPAFNSQDLFGSSRPGAPYYEDSKLPAVQFGGVTAPVSQSQPSGVAPASVPPAFVGFSAPPAQAWQQNDPPSFVAFPTPPGEAMPEGG